MNWITYFRSIILGSIISLLLVPNVLAHSPVFNDYGSPSLEDAFLISELDNSKAIFGAIRQPGAVDYYRIETPSGYQLSISLFVPAACENFYPQMAIIGQGIASSPTQVQLQVPPGSQARVLTLEANQWGTFFEPFDPAFYASGPTLELQTLEGTYFLAIYDVDGGTGSYMLGTGGAERWSPDEDWRERKATYDTCEFGQSNPLIQNWRKIAAGITLLLPIGIGIVWLSYRNKQKKDHPTEEG